MQKNKPDADALLKINKKRLFKIRCKIQEIKSPYRGVLNVLCYKGAGAKKKLFMFSAFGDMHNQIRPLLKDSRVKLWFDIKTKEYMGKYYTELEIKHWEYWQVNEDKLKKEAYQKSIIDNHNYIQSKSENNEGFLS